MVTRNFSRNRFNCVCTISQYYTILNVFIKNNCECDDESVAIVYEKYGAKRDGNRR